MKRLFGMLLILTFIYICIQLGFKYFGNGHLVEYEVKNGAVEATVREKFVTRTKDERDNYYFDILIGKQAFSFQTFLNFKKYDHVLTNLYYYEDEQYACIYPIFKIHTQVTDVLCKDQSGMIRYYHDMKNDNASLTAFVQELSKNNLYKNMWQDRLEKTEEALHVVLYNENIVDGHYLGVDHYSGLYLVNNYSNRQLFNTIVFNKDYYDKPLSAQVGKYVIVADYGSTYDFDTFHFVDLVYNQKDTIRYHSKFSFSSYFQGSVDHSIYLFDPEAKKQYEIDLKAKNIKEIGNEQIGIKYYHDGILETRPLVDALKQKLLFSNYTSSDYGGYERVDKVGNVLSGYYYFYKKVNGGYQVYRSNVQNKEQLTYLFTTSELCNILYVQEYVYYKEGNYIKYYSDSTGVRTLLKDSEFEFNKGLQFYVYEHK